MSNGGEINYNLLCDQFVLETHSDPVAAHIYLQRSNWNLSTAIQMFEVKFGENNDGDSDRQPSSPECDEDGDGVENCEISDGSPEMNMSAISLPIQQQQIVPPPPLGTRKRKTNPLLDAIHSSHRAKVEVTLDLRILTWNVDGLDDKNRLSRTKKVGDDLDFWNADIVFLQEVLVETVSVLENRLPEYQFIYGNGTTPMADYFTVVMLKKSLVTYKRHTEVPFEGSRMGRTMMIVEASYGELDLVLINAHLESCKENAEERVRQMAKCFDVMRNFPANKTVFFGGDLNTRDSEVEHLLSDSEGIVDLWIACGASKDNMFTWDCLKNDNLEWKGKLKPRCRFDRLYLRNSSLTKLRPVQFRLAGTWRVAGALCYPSDHWGITCRLEYP